MSEEEQINDTPENDLEDLIDHGADAVSHGDSRDPDDHSSSEDLHDESISPEDHNSEDRFTISVMSDSAIPRERNQDQALGKGRGKNRGGDHQSKDSGISGSIADSSSESSRPAGDANNKGRGRSNRRPTGGSDGFNLINSTEIAPSGSGNYEAVATTQPDKLTGLFGGGPVKTAYTWLSLGDSLLKVRGRAAYDIVDQFKSGDVLVAPASITTTSITASNGTINKPVAGQINAKVLNKTTFLANSAAAFTCTGLDGLFVAFNDARPGYQQNSDTLLFLANYAITSGPVVVN